MMSRSADHTHTLGSTRKVYLLEAFRGKVTAAEASSEVSQSRQRRDGGHPMASAVCSRGHLTLDE